MVQRPGASPASSARCSTSSASGARSARSFSGRQARLGTLAAASVARRARRSSSRINYLASRHNKRWDLTAAKQFSLSDQTKKVLQGLTEAGQVRVFDAERRTSSASAIGSTSTSTSRSRCRSTTSTRREAPGAGEQFKVQRARHGRPRVRRAHRAGHVGRRAGADQRADQGRPGQAAQGLLRPGPRRAATRRLATRSGYSTHRARRSTSDNFPTDNARARAAEAGPGRRRRSSSSPDRRPISSPPEIDMLKAYLAKGGKILFLLDPPDQGRRAAAHEPRGAAQGLGHRGRQQRRRRRQRHGPAARHRRVGAGGGEAIRPHPITEHFNLLTAYPLARSVTPVDGRLERPHRAESRRDQPNSWAETDIKELTTTGQVARELDKGDKAGPVSLAAAVSAPVGGCARTRGADRSGDKPADAAKAGNADRRCSATPTSPPTATSGSRATATCSSTPSTGWRSRRT